MCRLREERYLDAQVTENNQYNCNINLMSAKDKFHDAVKQALVKEGWEITHDPLRIKFGEEDKIQIDLGAQRVLGAQKAGQKIAVEIKSFLSDSAVFDFHLALGQFLNYRLVLEATEPERVLYLAVPTLYLPIFLLTRFTLSCNSKISD